MEQYTIKMTNFEGPLDLLCHLIDKNKMDIFDIKINHGSIFRVLKIHGSNESGNHK